MDKHGPEDAAAWPMPLSTTRAPVTEILQICSGKSHSFHRPKTVLAMPAGSAGGVGCVIGFPATTQLRLTSVTNR